MPNIGQEELQMDQIIKYNSKLLEEKKQIKNVIFTGFGGIWKRILYTEES